MTPRERLLATLRHAMATRLRRGDLPPVLEGCVAAGELRRALLERLVEVNGIVREHGALPLSRAR